MISAKWYEAWGEYVEWDEDDNDKPVTENKVRPGPIDNSDLYAFVL